MSKIKIIIIIAVICLILASALLIIEAPLLRSGNTSNNEPDETINQSNETTKESDVTTIEDAEMNTDNKIKLQRAHDDFLVILKENSINMEGCSSMPVDSLNYILVQVKKEDIETVKKLASSFEAKTGVYVSVKKQPVELPDGLDYFGVFDQTKLVIADEKLMQSFYQKGVGIVYPEWFGGSKINRDSYIVFIAKDKGGITVKELDAFFGDTASDVFYFISKYSYNEMQNIANKVSNTLLDEGYSLCEYYVNLDYEGGAIFIGVDEKSLNQKYNIRNMELQNIQNRAAEIAEEMGRGNIPILIEAVERLELQSITEQLPCGAPLGKAAGSSNFTLGVFGEYNGNLALATCGHINGVSVGSTIYYGNKAVGTIVVKQYTNNGSGDYSIVKTTGLDWSHVMGSSLQSSTVINGYSLNPAIGTEIIRYGKTRRYLSGTIIAINATYIYTDPDTNVTTIIYGMSKAEISSDDFDSGGGSLPGDSGGPYVTSTGKFCGTHTAGGANSRYIWFSPYIRLYTVGFTAYAEHISSSWEQYSATHHRGYCIKCCLYATQSHTNYYDPSLDKCTRCGYYDPVIVIE